MGVNPQRATPLTARQASSPGSEMPIGTPIGPPIASPPSRDCHRLFNLSQLGLTQLLA